MWFQGGSHGGNNIPRGTENPFWRCARCTNTHVFARDFGQQRKSRLIIAPPGQWIRVGVDALLMQIACELVICSRSLGYGRWRGGCPWLQQVSKSLFLCCRWHHRLPIVSNHWRTGSGLFVLHSHHLFDECGFCLRDIDMIAPISRILQYFTDFAKASATPNCRPVPVSAVLFDVAPRPDAWGGSCASIAGWQLARWHLKLDVLPRVTGTLFLPQILHIGSSKFAGSPFSLGWKPKCSQTGDVT